MISRTLCAALTAVTLQLATAPPVAARGRVGELAPYFSLKTLSGRRVTRDTLRGKITVLVVGLTLEAAPPCKKWGVELIRRTKADVYQVIVADKAWYLPRSAVLSRIRDFSPRKYDDRVLIEWYTVFADAYGIPKADDPYVVVLDRRGVIRERLRAQPKPHHLRRVQRLLARLLRESRAKQRPKGR